MKDNQQKKRRSRSLGLFLRPRRFAIEIGSTRSEVARLIAAKMVEVVDINGMQYVPVKEVARIRGVATSPRPVGRPRKMISEEQITP